MDFFLFLILFVSFPSSIASAWLAGQKGHEPVSWGIAGLILGPFAVVTIGFAPRGYRGDFKECVECSEAIWRTATRCPYCGTDLIQAEAEDRALSEDDE